MAKQGLILMTGKFFGEDMILHNSRRSYSVRSLVSARPRHTTTTTLLHSTTQLTTHSPKCQSHTRTHTPTPLHSRSQTYVDVLSLHKFDLEMILSTGDFPETSKMIRRSGSLPSSHARKNAHTHARMSAHTRAISTKPSRVALHACACTLSLRALLPALP